MKVSTNVEVSSDRSLLLAIETSGRDLAVALAASDDGATVAAYLAVERAGAAHRLVGVVDFLLGELGASKSALGAVAVNVGPGSFTGIRVGCVVAKTIAHGLGLPLVAVPALAARARAHMQGPLEPGWPAVVMQDARRGNVYGAVYAAAEESDEMPWRELVAPVLLPAVDFVAAAAEAVSGGPAALCCEEALMRALGERAGVVPAVWEFMPGGPNRRLTAEQVAVVGAELLAANCLADAAKLEPRYVAAPSAKLPKIPQPD